jgi:hypothetical protein
MYALVIDETITKYFSYPKGFTLNGNQYPADIFTKWSVEEKEAIGIYEVVFDDSNKKDEAYYINTNQSFNFADGKVTASLEQLLLKLKMANPILTRRSTSSYLKDLKSQ